MISVLHPNGTQSKAAFESKMLALLSLAKSKRRTPYNAHNVFQIVSVMNEAPSSVFWWGSAWLLEWSEQSTNQYDCSRLLLKRHTTACVQHDCCSSARAVLKGTLTWFRTTAQMPCNQHICCSSKSAGKRSLIDTDGRDVNVDSRTSFGLITWNIMCLVVALLPALTL